MSGCEVLRTANGIAFACARGGSKPPACGFCKHVSVALCDGYVGDGTLCSAPICGEHRERTPGKRDLCPNCVRMAR